MGRTEAPLILLTPRLELKAAIVEAVGGVEDDYPLQKKRHSFEFLRTVAHLRPRTNTIGAVLRVRNAASRAIHDFFQKRGEHQPASRRVLDGGTRDGLL